jgi:hypothetical protein
VICAGSSKISLNEVSRVLMSSCHSADPWEHPLGASWEARPETPEKRENAGSCPGRASPLNTHRFPRNPDRPKVVFQRLEINRERSWDGGRARAYRWGKPREMAARPFAQPGPQSASFLQKPRPRVRARVRAHSISARSHAFASVRARSRAPAQAQPPGPT